MKELTKRESDSMTKETKPRKQMPPSISDRVFGIGMNKTGTTSLKRCFQNLGLHPIAPSQQSSAEIRAATRCIFEKRDFEPALQFAESYRAFEDRPWNVWEMYRHLDMRFPGSRFILTVRDPESWWRSVERWITFMKPWMAERYRVQLRSPSLAKDDMIQGYLRYNREVTDYFQGKDNLLIMDLEKGDGWVPLCTFLGCPVPQKLFPHVNRMTYDKRDLDRKKTILRRRRKRRQKRKISALGRRIISFLAKDS